MFNIKCTNCNSVLKLKYYSKKEVLCKNILCGYKSSFIINSDNKIIDYTFFFKRNNIIYIIDGNYYDNYTMLSTFDFAKEILLKTFPYQNITYNKSVTTLCNRLLKLFLFTN